MRVAQIRTVHFGMCPNVTFVEVETDTGLVGLGETFYTPRAVTAYLEEVVAPQLLAWEPFQIEALWRRLYDGSHVYGNKGLEMRCLAAVDIALWDLFGQHLGAPVCDLLGGTSHAGGVPVYNTCASSGYAQGTPGIARAKKDTSQPVVFDDHAGWQPGADAGKLARSLLEMGIRAMKIWPFDPAALANRGQTISGRDLAAGVRPFAEVRDAVGDDMEIILEGHGYWALEPARKIAAALEPYRPALLEDLMKPDNPRTLAKLRASTRIPICASELVMSRYAMADVLAADACDVVMTDIGWAGGITEARKVANLADTHNLGVIFHDCTGPVTLAAALHVGAHVTNTWMQEIVRAYTHGYYRELCEPAFELTADGAGRMLPPPGPGLGVRLRAAARQRPDATVRVLARAA
jgi:L-alanine-DL-glutamate epimerase-like enolase superfamily enzyme